MTSYVKSWIILSLGNGVKYYYNLENKTFRNASIFGDSLASPWWLLLAFCTNILGDGRDLWIVVLLEKECSFSGADNVRWWGLSNTTRRWGYKNFPIFPSSQALALVHIQWMIVHILNIFCFELPCNWQIERECGGRPLLRLAPVCFIFMLCVVKFDQKPFFGCWRP